MNLLKAEAARHGEKLEALSAFRLMDIKRDFDEKKIDTSPYYRFGPRDDLGFTAQSVLVVASPSPALSVTFTINGEKKPVLIPATYADAEVSEARILKYLSVLLEENGYHILPARGLPCKPIAVRSGLGALGRNNIVYVDGMGSFLSLHLFFTDAPCRDVIEPLKRMECCENCVLCAQNCPTSALTTENTLIDAERCLTMMNENGGDFPAFVEPSFHNALIGCTRCQWPCPQNQPFISSIKEAAHFDENETRAILEGNCPEETLASLGFTHYAGVLPRNLSAVLVQN